MSPRAMHAAPTFANEIAVARPMPREPPVMKTERLLRIGFEGLIAR